MSNWRLIEDGKNSAEVNMATDEALFELLRQGYGHPCLRLYFWDRPSISIGRFQSLSRTINQQVASELGVPLVRRVTGGRGILHGDDVTVAVTAQCTDLGLPCTATIENIYSRLIQVFKHAFQISGLKTAAGKTRCFTKSRETGDCFAISAPSDLVALSTGVKVMGGAMHRSGDYILFQASVPLRTVTFRTQVQHATRLLFQGELADTDAPEVVPGVFAVALKCAWEEHCGLFTDHSQVTAFEADAVKSLTVTRYGNARWTNGVRSVLAGNLN